MSNLKNFIAKVATGDSLDQNDATEAFGILMSGEATHSQIGGFLMSLRVRGETIDEITGAATAMRAKMVRVKAPDDAIDIVGTGGDGSGSYNISTAAAIVTAACGVSVAKHGNRALSSKSGASDVLAALGVNLAAGRAQVEKAIDQAKIGFLMAPLYHSAMKHVGPSRVELGTRTIFNLLGPLTNPAGVKRQFTGVFARQWIEPMAHVLANLGSERAWVVHGSDGLDELTTTGPSTVAELKNGTVRTFEISPEDAGLARVSGDDLQGGSPQHNARALMAVLQGEPGPYRDVVVYNAGAALLVAGQAGDVRDGVALAMAAIDNGTAKATLDKLISITNESS